MSIVIRPYRDTDLKMCRNLWVQLTEWHRTIYDAPSIGGDDPGSQFDEHLARVGTDRVWLAEIDNVVVGMTGLQPGSEEGSLEIEPLVVLPGVRSKGVGRALVEHLIEVIHGLGMRDLNVRVVGRNADAIRFYHELGFDTVGYFELFLDTRPETEQPWRAGETIAERRFRV